ncbi:hypothetical protein R1flu_004337 [Riccia fluitans]|uniref:CNH domain-containing protein n=1 Tax=Riccia fluitans TaxID=41844 RepID=A0ABD1YQK6_9MARC
MVHNAFDSRQILRDCPARIESVGLWGPRLLLGCIDGSLRIYAPEETVEVLPSDSEVTVPTYTLKDTRIGFAKKAVTHMDVLQSRGLLVTLSDAVAIHTLPEFEVVSYLTKTKGAAMYCWDEDRGLLAVAKLKRIFVYRYDGSRGFTETKDLPAPDTVNAMAWCSGALCLGIRKEYIIMNINTGVTVEVFSSGRSANPMIVSLPNGNLLLGKDKIGVIVDHNGKPTEDGGLSWNEIPAGVVIHPPYALARLSRHVEVRSLKAPHGLVQMLPLSNIQLLLSSDAGLIAATESTIHRILPVPIPVQVVQLSASGNFLDALALCRMLPPEDAALRASKEDAIHIRYGHYLFEQGEYVEAMDHFGASSLDLTTILSLFPSVKLPSLVSPVSGDVFSDGHPIGTPTERSRAGLSTDEDTSPSATQAESSKLQDVQQRKIALSALAGFLSSRRRDVIAKAEAEETDAAVAAMVEASPVAKRNSEKLSEATFDKRLNEARQLAIVLDTALVQALLATDQSQAALKLLKGANYCDIAPCEEMMLAAGHYLELIELYKSHQMHPQALRLLNTLAEKPDSFAVPPEDSLELRSQNILDYLKAIGSLDPTLVLESSNWILKNNVEETMKMFAGYNPPLPINQVLAYLKKNFPELRVLYLEHMLGQHADAAPAELQNELLQLYLTRVLEERSTKVAEGKWDERDHSEAREKLLKVLQNTTAYSPDRILQRLPVDGLYEERAYLLGRLGQHRLALTLYAHKLHEADLALAYCDRVYTTATAGRKAGKPTSRTILPPVDSGAMNIYLTLLEVYLKPKAAVREYDRSLMTLAPARTFAGARPSPQQQQRTRGGVAKKIAEIEGAEESKFSFSSAESAAESSRSDTEELVEGPTTSSEDLMLDDALRLLSRRWDRLDGAQALRMIPSDTKLNNLLPFLEPLLRTSSESRRNSAVIKSLHRSENLQVREELLQCRKRVVKMNSDRTCSICRKRIGTSVFAVYPSGTLAHFVCYRDSGVSRPAVGSVAAGF